VAVPSTSPAQPSRSDPDLADGLISLAGTPDDEPDVSELLKTIVQLSVHLLPPVSYASMTAHHKDSYSTVAMSDAVALAVDEAQYTEQAGPCLDALRTAAPTAVPRIDTTVSWPHFREAAGRLGLHASLSIPLFAGRGVPIAALNLYSRDSDAMAPLCAAVVDVYRDAPENDDRDLGSGAIQLVSGLTGAFAVRATIQQALGIIMAVERTDADFAYRILRSRAAQGARSLTATAGSILARSGDEQR
jgi:hypothetical protein